MLDKKEIEQRSELWLALSNLWLDTELDENDYEFIANRMIDSNYSLNEIENILSQEVAPVLYKNLSNVAGEWVGFDKDWLINAICENLKENENMFSRTWNNSGVRKWITTSMVKDDWSKVVTLYKSKIS
jgi:hypothetical protein